MEKRFPYPQRRLGKGWRYKHGSWKHCFTAPFHGMKSYPPSVNDSYPKDPDLQKFIQEYNTRVVTSEDFRNAIKNKY